jgi:hypothetical protein
VNADITTDTTWSGQIVLEKPIFVKSGATLTILPGTIVRGQPRTSAPVQGQQAGSPGALIVTQTGRIIADASASNPIIMTTAAVDNNNDGIADDDDTNGFEDAWVSGDTFLDDTPTTAPLAPLNKAGNSNVGLWGGLAILGNAPTNNAHKALGADDFGQTTIEGLTFPGFPEADAKYGGILPHDNSGILRYVSVRHAGDEIGEGNELNGVSLGGVGDGTTLENIEVYANFDDGVEWFGGTVNGKNLAVFFVGDDMFDLDEGYTGVNQFLFGIMPFFNENDGQPYGSGSGDKACEFDGDNYRPDNVALNGNVAGRIDVDQTTVDEGAGGPGTEMPTPWPLSNPQMYNMTLIGSTPDAPQEFTPTSPALPNLGCQVRHGFAGEVLNSIVVNTGAQRGLALDTGTGEAAPGHDAIDNVNAGLISLVSSTLDDGAALAAAELTAVSNGDAMAPGLGGTANVVNGAFSGLVKEDATFNPTGNAAGKLVSSLKSSPVNPRPVGVIGVIGGVVPRGSGLDPAATYRGAFAGTAPILWTTGWTTLNVAGLLAD